MKIKNQTTNKKATNSNFIILIIMDSGIKNEGKDKDAICSTSIGIINAKNNPDSAQKLAKIIKPSR